MQGEHASTIQALIKWFHREDDIGKITSENYKPLASLANKWDIPMLLHDIDVTFLSLNYLNSALSLRFHGIVSGFMDFCTSI